MALRARRPTHVIHHSDQVYQYTSVAFELRCHEAGVQPSMGSVRGAYDNAPCESLASRPSSASSWIGSAFPPRRQCGSPCFLQRGLVQPTALAFGARLSVAHRVRTSGPAPSAIPKAAHPSTEPEHPTGVGPSGLVASHGPPVDSGRRDGGRAMSHRVVTVQFSRDGQREGVELDPDREYQVRLDGGPPSTFRPPWTQVQLDEHVETLRNKGDQQPTADHLRELGKAAGRGHPRHPGHGRRARPDERQRAPDSVVAA